MDNKTRLSWIEACHALRYQYAECGGKTGRCPLCVMVSPVEGVGEQECNRCLWLLFEGKHCFITPHYALDSNRTRIKRLDRWIARLEKNNE
jgi:hypothetical protein